MACQETSVETKNYPLNKITAIFIYIYIKKNGGLTSHAAAPRLMNEVMKLFFLSRVRNTKRETSKSEKWLQ